MGDPTATSRTRRAGMALACYLLSLAVGLSCMGAPFLLALAAPQQPAHAAQNASERGGVLAGARLQDVDDTPAKVTPEKMSLKAYPIVNDGSDDWDTDDGDTRQIAVNGGRLRLLVTVTWSDGRRIAENQLAWSERGGFTQGFTYESSDTGTLAVGPTGIVTALDNGETTVTVVPKNEGEEYQALSASITITTANQGTGLMVTRLQIVDKNNKPYGDNPLKFTATSRTVALYARVTYQDKANKGRRVVYSNAPGAPQDERPQGEDGFKSVEEAFETLSWWAGDSKYLSVTSRKGVCSVKALANSTTRVYATITGGDTTLDFGFGYGVVYGTVAVSVDNGKTQDGHNPSDELKVKVVYEKDVDTVVKKKTYSVKQFEKLGATTRSYTLTQKAGSYATDRAYGVPLATVLHDLKIATSDVAYFRLAANDGANPGRLSAKYLLKTTRYYLPNYDIGGSWAEKEQVPTMIALKDSWNSNTMVTGELNSGTRFRLVFGAATSADSATDKSIKYINTLTIVMSGSAPVKHGDKEEVTHKQGGSGGGSGSNAGAGTGGVGGGSGDASSNSNSQGEQRGIGEKTGEAAEEQSVPWRIFEMMNKSMSDLVVQYQDNPFLPFLVPVTGGVVIVSATARYVVFRRKLG